MFKNWLLAGVVVLSGSAFVANEADAFGHRRCGQSRGGCNPCGGGYAQPVVIQQPISGGCCGTSYRSGHGGLGQPYQAGYRGVAGGYGYQGPGVGMGVRGVGTGVRGVGTGVRGVGTGVRGVVGGFTGW